MTRTIFVIALSAAAVCQAAAHERLVPICRYTTGATLVIKHEVCDDRYEHFPTLWVRPGDKRWQ
jgi:hypothetical protein